MLKGVVEHVTALAKRREVSRAIPARVVLEVATGQDHPGDRQPRNGVEAVQGWLLGF